MPRVRFTLRDLIWAVLLAALLVSALLPSVNRMHDYSWPLQCVSNLREIGIALSHYMDLNRGRLPQTRYDPNDPTARAYTNPMSRDPFAADGPLANDVTAAYFLLTRTQGLSADVFICPATMLEPWDFGGVGRKATDCSNFPGPEHLSYSFHNPYPSVEMVAARRELRAPLSPEFAVAADMNPGVPELLVVGKDATTEALTRLNSFNHYRGGEGSRDQNVLFGDGHVDRVQNPFVGVERDNIYAVAATGSHVASIVGPAADENDSVLLPVATVDPSTGRAFGATRVPVWVVVGMTVAGIAGVVGVVFMLRRRSRGRFVS